MALATKSGRAVDRDSDQSAANTTIAVTTPTGPARQFFYATVTYSAAATQTVTLKLKSGIATAYDIQIASVATAGATEALLVSAGNNIFIAEGDALEVSAPAGGVGITASVAIYSRSF